MEAIILKCPDFGRFHFGTVAPDSDTALSQTSECFQSDTLFSALISTCAKILPPIPDEEKKPDDIDVNDLVEFFKNGGVLISSGSYCLDIFENGNNINRIFFLPKPCHLDLLDIDDESHDRKQVKKVKYISKSIWENGFLSSEWKESGCYLIDRKFAIDSSEVHIDLGDQIEKIFKIISEPKIADHARKKENNIFFQTDVFLQTTHLSRKELEDAGYEGVESMTFQPHFYFLIDFKVENDRMKNLISLLLDVLKDDGIGGGISIGCGRIKEIERAEWSLSPVSVADNQAVSASLISVSESENSSVLFKDLVVRGGRNTAAHGQLKRIKMAMPGALIKKETEGRIEENLHDSIPFLRYGMAFPLSIHSNYEYND